MEILDDKMTPDKTGLNQDVVQMNIDESAGRVRTAAYWFFGIAALSFINILLAAKGVYFILGLAISQVIAVLISENIFVAFVGPIMFIIIGYFAAVRERWAFTAGIALYILDALIYLYFSEWLAFAFHAFVIYKLIQGYKEIKAYERLLAQKL